MIWVRNVDVFQSPNCCSRRIPPNDDIVSLIRATRNTGKSCCSPSRILPRTCKAPCFINRKSSCTYHRHFIDRPCLVLFGFDNHFLDRVKRFVQCQVENKLLGRRKRKVLEILVFVAYKRNLQRNLTDGHLIHLKVAIKVSCYTLEIG